MKRRTASGFAALVAALLLVAATFAASRVEAQGTPGSADFSISQRVESALAEDRALRDLEIHVETLDGVVNLRGFVRSLEQAAKAGDLARAVRGVMAVRNGLRLADRPSRA
jgi:osmotically-inducible protein OsmY